MELYCQVLMLLHKEYHDAKYAHSDIHANHQTTKLCHTNQQQKGGDKRSLVDTYIKKKDPTDISATRVKSCSRQLQQEG